MTNREKIHHWAFYFGVLGIISAVGYLQRWADDVFLILLGPAIYLSSALKKFVTESIWPLPNTEAVNFYFFLTPINVLYFALAGFLLQQLLNERGKIRWLAMLAFLSFIGFLHYAAWSGLSEFLSA